MRPPRPHSSMWASVSGLRQRLATNPMTVTRAKKKMKTASAVPLMSVVMANAPIGNPGQRRGDRHPEKLIPVEEGKAEKRRLAEIVECRPEQTYVRNDQQPQRCLATWFFHVGVPFRRRNLRSPCSSCRRGRQVCQPAAAAGPVRVARAFPADRMLM
ncbi:hypothetical protein RHECNPAF_1360023 [Rhizobium etli CNPAF512]|nr:hypothetical protein RHECNPAF_1360023 [Rhizobium etli CNPAF512]